MYNGVDWIYFIGRESEHFGNLLLQKWGFTLLGIVQSYVCHCSMRFKLGNNNGERRSLAWNYKVNTCTISTLFDLLVYVGEEEITGGKSWNEVLWKNSCLSYKIWSLSNSREIFQLLMILMFMSSCGEK